MASLDVTPRGTEINIVGRPFLYFCDTHVGKHFWCFVDYLKQGGMIDMFCVLSSNFLGVKHAFCSWSIAANLMRGETGGQEQSEWLGSSKITLTWPMANLLNFWGLHI